MDARSPPGSDVASQHVRRVHSAQAIRYFAGRSSRSRHTALVTKVVFDPERRRVTVGPWSERSVVITPPIDVAGPWTAVLELRRHVNLMVEAAQGAKSLRAALWAGQPAFEAHSQTAAGRGEVAKPGEQLDHILPGQVDGQTLDGEGGRLLGLESSLNELLRESGSVTSAGT